MSNIIEKHPGYTLLIVSIGVMTTTWAILTFVLEDNKVNFYKAQIESVKAETENIKSQNSTYKSKIEFLEKENDKLNSINKLYLEYINKNPNSIPFLQKRIEDIISENNLLKNNTQKVITKKDSLGTIITKKIDTGLYNFTAEISRGEAYYDERTGLTIGLNEINGDRNASINLTLPDREAKKETVGAGKVYEFKNSTRNYILIIKKIEYYSNTLNFQIREQ